MTGKFCCLLVAWLLFAPTKHLFAQQRFILTVADSAAIAYVDTTGIINPVTFADPGVDGLIHSATITTFKQLAPFSNYEHTRHLWRIEGVDSAFMDQLRLFYPRLFPAYRLETEPVSLAYYPSDWSGPGYSSVNYLDFIGAPMAWDTSYGCQGDANTLIGITDTWFDMTNNDFQGKIAHIGPNVFRNDGNDYHGTHVASVAGARTNNGYLLPSIGFKCNLSLSSDRSSVEFLRLA